MKATKIYLFLLSFVLIGLVSCSNKQVKEELNSFKAQKELEERNKSIVKQYWEGKWKARDIDILDELLTRNVVHHGSNEINGVEEYKQVYSMYRSALHDSNIIIEELIAEGDKVMTRCVMTCIHKGQLGDIPPTDKELNLRGYTVFRLEDGKIAEEWEILDGL